MPVPARQVFEGQLYPPDKWVQERTVRGQINPTEEERLRRMDGRYLSGLGESPDGLGADDHGGVIGDDPNYPNGELSALEKQDDSYGSGIFGPYDDYTANKDMGIFASTYAVPGYVGREVPYAVSRDVSDISEGGEVVYVPGGGLSYVTEDPPAVLGPTPVPPRQLAVREPDTVGTYVNIAPGPPQPSLNAMAPVVRPQFAPARVDRGTVYPVPSWPQYRAMGANEAPDEAPSALSAFLWGGAAGAAAGLLWVFGAPWLKRTFARRRP
jgi:hypothetical protein